MLTQRILRARLVAHIDRRWPEFGARLRLLKQRRAGDAVLDCLERFSEEGSVVVDVGANRGVYTLRLSELVGPTGRVYALEPHPECLEALDQIARRHRNVAVLDIAASDQSGHLTLHTPVVESLAISARSSVEPQSGHVITTEVVTKPLDEALPAEARPISLIKIDVEGHEPAVITGARATIDRWRPTLVIEIEQRHRQSDIQETFRELEAMGYSGYFLDEGVLRPIADFSVEVHQLGWIDASGESEELPPQYVSDFVFTADEL